MADSYSKETDERASRQHDAASELATQSELELAREQPVMPGYSLSLLGDEKTESRGNSPVRSSVMQTAQQTHGNRSVQRFLQRMAAEGATAETDDELARRIETKSGGGSPLDKSVLGKLEQGLGADLSDVRVHTDPEADKLARSVDSIAFTSGQDIFFRSGMFSPESAEGLRLLAHEATHTVQQSQGPVEGTPSEGGVSISDPSDRHEQAAERAAESVVSSGPAAAATAHQAAPVQRSLLEDGATPVQRFVGWKPPQAEETPRGYAYGEVNDRGGVSGGFSALSGSGTRYGIPMSVDWLTGNGSAGAWDDGQGGTRYGITGNAAVNRWSLGNTGQGSPVQFDAGVGTANAEASLGDSGATLGVGANVVEGALTVGNFNRNSSTDEQARFGLSYGVGAAGRLHWGDSDKDGHREYGFGADIGPVSFDIKTEDPLRTGLGMIPGVGPLARMGADYFAPGTNLTDAAGNAISSGYNAAKEYGGRAYDAVRDYGSRAYNTASDYASRAYDTAGDYANRAYDTASRAYDTASDYAGRAYDTVSSAAGSAYDTVSNAASSAYDTASSAASGAYDTVSSAASSAYDWLTDW